jgi:hypothetical protein
MMPSSKPGRLLVVGRLVIGVTSWSTPGFALRSLGLDDRGNPQAAYINRLFGVRDVALGAGLILARGKARRLWWQIGFACDLFDAAAGVLAARDRELPISKLARANLLIAPILGAGLGAAALRSKDV